MYGGGSGHGAAGGGAPDPTGGYRPERGAPGTRFPTVRWFERIDSTNRYLLDEARAGAPEGTVAAADFQSAGRGRLGRRWEAPPGSNLLVSVLLRPALAPSELHLCTVAVALAAADACAATAGLRPELKWPNDLMVGDRKLAGVLAEAIPGGHAPPGAPPGPAGRPAAVVVGLGLNVGWPGPDAPDAAEDELLSTATSIRRETGAALTPAGVLGPLLAGLEQRLAGLADAEGRRRVAAEYRRRCATLGRAVAVSCAGETFSATALDVTDAGLLVVDVDGVSRTVAAGDVVHVRHGP